MDACGTSHVRAMSPLDGGHSCGPDTPPTRSSIGWIAERPRGVLYLPLLTLPSQCAPVLPLPP